ncbi:amidohydrolase family protein [Breoghania sp. L-A4]|uniref:amidohydrolase family protein n=1 Tax=Breoghania sp. L-A4 TaxID=2304600 RepID=UPI000E3591F1|nr:amidohydrolase family protein [Breoghania sp. L-A4]AXS41534.1 amidohydrolase [Breoghania sp. L-A4]
MSGFLIRQVRVAGSEGLVDVAVRDGAIAEIGPGLSAPGEEIDGAGALLIPGFVESHIHLDKACILDRCRNETGTLEGAIASVVQAKAGFTEADVYARGKGVLEKAIVQGTNALRTHVEIDPVIGLKGFEAVLRLKRDFAWALDLQMCVFPQDGLTNLAGTRELLEQALDMGADLLGGCPYTDADPQAQIRILFEMARAHDVDLDFHLDFDLDPSWRHLDEIARQTIAFGWQGRVAIGHVTKLSALPPDDLAQAIGLMREAGVALTVLPATDLFLMGRGSDHLVPRGVAPAHLFHAQGVCCTVATNNVLNPFTPYGDLSLPRMANLYANVHQLSTKAELEACFDMVTDAPRRLIDMARRIAVGEEATFVALPATSGGQVVAEIVRPLWGMKRGRMTFEQAPARLFAP